LASAIRKEVLWLVAWVVALDGLFGAVYFLGHVSGGSDAAKLGFTAVWTLAILIIVIRSLSRIRSARLNPTSKEAAH
jgi:hypothetical protein